MGIFKEMKQIVSDRWNEFKAKSVRNRSISVSSYLADVGILYGLFFGFSAVTGTLPMVGVAAAGIAAMELNDWATAKLQALPSKTDKAAAPAAPAVVAEAPALQVASPAAEFKNAAEPEQNASAAPAVESKPQPPTAG